MSYFREQLEGWLKMIEVRHVNRVLDVGGASNPVTHRLLGFENVKHYQILDNGTEPPRAGVEFIDFDINRDGSLVTAPTIKPADVVFCLEVFEYVYDPVTAIKNLSLWTARDGILYASFPFVYPMHNPPGKDYLRYTEEGVRKLLEIGGFEAIDIIPRVGRNKSLLRQFYAMDGMHPRKDATVDHVGYLVKAKRL